GQRRQIRQRDLEREAEDVEALEAVHAVARLAETTTEDARVEQVEDAGRVREEAVVTRTGERRLAGREVVDGLLGVAVERRESRGTRDGASVGIVVEGRGPRADVRRRDEQALADRLAIVALALVVALHGVALGVVLPRVAHVHDGPDLGTAAIGQDR